MELVQINAMLLKIIAHPKLILMVKMDEKLALSLIIKINFQKK